MKVWLNIRKLYFYGIVVGLYHCNIIQVVYFYGIYSVINSFSFMLLSSDSLLIMVVRIRASHIPRRLQSIIHLPLYFAVTIAVVKSITVASTHHHITIPFILLIFSCDVSTSLAECIACFCCARKNLFASNRRKFSWGITRQMTVKTLLSNIR